MSGSDIEIEMTSKLDEEAGGSMPAIDPRIGALPPRRTSKAKWFFIVVTFVLIAVAGLRFGGIYLVGEEAGYSDGETEEAGGVQADSAKAQEAFKNAGSAAHHLPGAHKNFNGKNGKHNGFGHHAGNKFGPGNNHGGAAGGGGAGGKGAAAAGGHDASTSGASGESSSSDSSSEDQGLITLCEDASQYDEWHNKTITLDDGAKFEVLSQFNHDKHAFTQGLTYANDVLYESTGLYGKSTVRILDSENIAVKKSISMDNSLFGEGMAFVNGTLVQITWKKRRGFIYDAATLNTIKEFQFSTTRNEGWGITWDACKNEFIVTDGSHYLHFWDPQTMTETRKIPVNRMSGKPADELNEIEFWHGRVLANVWYEDVLLVINPETGIVEKEYNFGTLWPKMQRRKEGADVFNGISISKDPDVLYVTGKNWDRMFKIRLQV